MSEFTFHGTGIQYHIKEIESVGQPGKEYWNKSDAELLSDREPGTRIWAYSFWDLNAALEPEPDNPKDPNAIRIMLNGVCCGYVPADLCAQIRPLLSKMTDVEAVIYGGPCKDITESGVLSTRQSYRLEVKITYDGAPVTRSSGARSSGTRGGKANAPVILQWVAAGALLIFALAMLPSFAFVPFILAAVLAAPIRPLRDLLARYRIRPWMIAAAAVILTVLGFILAPNR